MKFKTKEDLITVAKSYGKENNYQQGYQRGYIDGVSGTFKSFTERIKFYKKYHNDYKQFLKDFPDLKREHHYLWLNHHNFDNEDEHWNEFNCWLFDYCFGDVI